MVHKELSHILDSSSDELEGEWRTHSQIGELTCLTLLAYQSSLYEAIDETACLPSIRSVKTYDHTT